MPFFLLVGGALGLGILFFSSGVSDMTTKGKRIYDLPDVEPLDQGGTYKTDYDVIFETVANETNVPFALLKAHAITESSLNPLALTDENPGKTPDRSGWASRGLMQILFWQNSSRLEQFGYSADDLFDSVLGDGGKLFDPYINAKIGGLLIKANLQACGGNLRDAVNMYNAGVKESVRVAPNNYVGKVIGYYSTLVKENVT